jgi:putative transposase
MGRNILLTEEDKGFLKEFVKTGKRNAKEIEHGYILLALNNKKSISGIMDFYEVGRTTIWRIKNKYIEFGLEAALKDAPRSGQPNKYSGKGEAEIVALACTQAPPGRSRWTLRLMEQELHKRDGTKTVTRETIRLVLKKRNVSLG